MIKFKVNLEKNCSKLCYRNFLAKWQDFDKFWEKFRSFYELASIIEIINLD